MVFENLKHDVFERNPRGGLQNDMDLGILDLTRIDPYECYSSVTAMRGRQRVRL